MKKRLRIVSALIFIFLLAMPFQTLAGPKDTPHSHDEETDEPGHEDDDHGHGDDDHAHDEDDDHGHGDDDHAHDEGDDHGHGDDEHAHDEGDDHGHGDNDHTHDEGDDHTHDYEETGANLPLLGTFAAINGGFIIFGAVRKINKKRKSGVK